MLKRAFLVLVMIGIVLGLIRQNAGSIGVGVIDDGWTALDASLREYVHDIEAYFADGEQVAGDSVVDRFEAATERASEREAGDTPEDDSLD